MNHRILIEQIKNHHVITRNVKYCQIRNRQFILLRNSRISSMTIRYSVVHAKICRIVIRRYLRRQKWI